jgi:hypothetical protein
MDVDQAKVKARLPLSCFCCGKVGHLGWDCPDRFDVRVMMTDELEAFLDDRLARLDVADANADVESIRETGPDVEPANWQEDCPKSSE